MLDKLSFQEWQDAIKNIRDVDRLARLGYKIYLNFYGAQLEAPDEAWNRANISAFARLLDLAFVHMRLKVRGDLRKHMLFQGKFVEPTLWEDPAAYPDPEDFLPQIFGTGADDTELLGHDDVPEPDLHLGL